MHPAIEQLAYDFLVDHGFHRLPITLTDLTGAIRSEGFDIVMYADVQELPFCIPPSYAAQPAVTYISAEGTGTVYSSTVFPLEERAFCLAHELGHIALRHTGLLAYGLSDSVCEKEADAWAYALLAPAPVLRCMGVYSVDDMQRYTSLDERRAAAALARVQGYQLRPSDLRLVAQFIVG